MFKHAQFSSFGSIEAKGLSLSYARPKALYTNRA